MAIKGHYWKPKPGRSLADKYPHLCADWDYDKNDLTPEQITYGSSYNAYWKCHDCGYEWQAQVRSRICKIKYPEYIGKRLIDVSQELFDEIKEFPDRYSEPEQLKADYRRTVTWTCHVCGHEWRDTPYHRTICDIQCPNCAKNAKEQSKRKAKIVSRENSIGVLYPHILQFWEFDKNKELGCTPYDISPGTSQKIYWKCPKCKYEWMQTPTVLIHGGNCPICAIKHATLMHEMPEQNKSFADLFPDLLSDWNYTKNSFSPYAIKPYSNKDVAWKCHICGYEWNTRLQNRTDGYQGCPKCAMNSHTSFPEQAVFFFLRRDLFHDAINQYLITQNDYTNYKYAIDIYVPSRKIAIEYDGEYWHNLNKAQERDNLKEKRINELGITLYRIVENSEINQISNNKLYFITHSNVSLKAYYNAIENAIIRLERLFGIENPVDIDLRKYRNDIIRQYQ